MYFSLNSLMKTYNQSRSLEEKSCSFQIKEKENNNKEDTTQMRTREREGSERSRNESHDYLN